MAYPIQPTQPISVEDKVEMLKYLEPKRDVQKVIASKTLLIRIDFIKANKRQVKN